MGMVVASTMELSSVKLRRTTAYFARTLPSSPRLPPSRNRYGGRDGGQEGGLYTILRNEPIILEDEFLYITLILKCLGRLQAQFAGGFVLENEPKIRGL